MYLKELRLHGFKSFADSTRLELRRGVTAIVGPNGCGKSNIADAIRWVLGEQSAKSLRAGAMQDVIFQGTATRKPVNLCQVSLLFTDCEDRLGAGYHEVEITRKVVRDGGSEYLLNGKVCRLKDIQRLFLDTGIGQVSYSFMLQGQIDQVLSSNPSERRAIFEEAAGISRYKAQRREALNKLTQVDANLARVTDVMEEVARQTGSLKRQAAKALRYQRIQHRLTHLDLAQSAFSFAQLNDSCTQLRHKQAFLDEELARITESLRHAEMSMVSKRDAVQDLRARMEAGQQKVYSLRAEKDTADNRAEMALLRQEDLRGRQGRLQQELVSLAEEEKAIADKLAGETMAKQQQLDLFGDSDEDFQRRSEELTGLQQKVGEAETALSRAKQALLVKEGTVSRLRSNVTTLELDLKTYQVRHANLAEEIFRLKEEESLLANDRDSYERTRLQRQQERDEQQQALVDLKERRQQMTTQFRDHQMAIQEKERQRVGVKAQIQVLEDLQAKFEGFSEGAKAVLQGRLDNVADRAQMRLFLEQLRVDAGYTAAVEQLLGVAAEAIFLQQSEALLPLARQLREQKLGKASFLVELAGRAAGAGPDAALPDGMVAAVSVVRAEDPRIQQFLQPYLSGCYIADSLEQVIGHWQANPDWQFRWVVTRNEEWIDSRGCLLVGASAQQKKHASFLARQNQIQQLKQELLGLDDAHERLRLEAGQLQGKLDGHDKRIEEQQALVSELGNELATLIAQRDGAARNLQTALQNLRGKQSELERLEESQEHSLKRLEAARRELEVTDADIAQLKEAVLLQEQGLEGLRQEREAQREQFNEARFEIAQKRQRLELLDRGLEALRQKSRENEAGRIQRLRELDEIGRQLEGLAAQAKEQQRIAEDFATQLQNWLAVMDKDRDALKDAERQLAVVEEGLAPKRESHAKLTSERNATEVAFAKEEARLQFLVEECQRNYSLDPRSVIWQHEIWQAGDELPERIRVDIEEESPEDMEVLQDRGSPPPEAIAHIEQSVDWAALRTELDSLRTRIQAIGPVNLVAITEYKELKERHAFLSSQSEDLWNAKNQLLQAIDEINQTSQKLFSDTFAAIRKNFHFTFDTLFGGGKADLELVDTGDVLESGIEITAQPPGTRLKTLGLLSGGQKTMTAVALLFAIYMVKPSPFCVLDEIDAPLDDANIGRFTSMLERFLEYSQFLIITHNKRTIKVADTIYGATMQEKGVSRMVSMRFDALRPGDTAAAETEDDSE